MTDQAQPPAGVGVPPAPPLTFRLLMARAGDHAPVLPGGLPVAAITDQPILRVPPPAPRPPDATHGDEPDDATRGDEPDDAPGGAPPPPLWGLIVPEGPDGDHLLALCDKLRKAREAQQGRPAPVYRVPAGPRPMALADALAWRRQAFDSGADLDTDRAVYQLVLGDLAQVPLCVQQVQSLLGGYVGRLHFSDEAGYAAYIDKLLRAEARVPSCEGRLVLHTAHDGSDAVDTGWKALVVPGEALLRNELDQGLVPASAILSYGVPSHPGEDVLLDHASGADPGVLFTLSHGLTAPFSGWSPTDQRALQGAMAFSVTAELTGSDVAARTFMPDGLWVMFACFSAGTPETSAYQPWLAGLPDHAPDVTRALAQGSPFIADLPQRALANPNGPLAFVGHVDLAWTFSYQDDGSPGQSRPGRFMRVLKSALQASPIGVAFQQLAGFVAELEAELNVADSSPDAAARRAQLWMMRQDLAGFILLGDPLARLPVRPSASPPSLAMGPVSMPSPVSIVSVGPVSAAPTSTGPASPTPNASPWEAAIAHAILGPETIPQIAQQMGLDPAELDRRVSAYREAGRRAAGIGGA